MKNLLILRDEGHFRDIGLSECVLLFPPFPRRRGSDR